MSFLLIFLLFSLSFSGVVARVDGKVVTKEEFEKAFKTYWKEFLHFSPGEPKKRDKERFLFEYMKGIVLEDVAREMGVRVSIEEVRERLRRWGIRRPSYLVERFARWEILVEKLEGRITEDISVSEKEIEVLLPRSGETPEGRGGG